MRHSAFFCHPKRAVFLSISLSCSLGAMAVPSALAKDGGAICSPTNQEVPSRYLQRIEGLWLSQNAYFAPDMTYRIPSYASLVQVSVEGDHLKELEIKYYPAGDMAQRASGSRSNANQGYEMITKRIFQRAGCSGRYQQVQLWPQAPRPSSVWMDILDEKTGVMKTQSTENPIEAYSLFSYSPTQDHRYMVNLGLMDGTDRPDLGQLKGFSTFFMERQSQADLKDQMKALRETYKIPPAIQIENDEVLAQAE